VPARSAADVGKWLLTMTFWFLPVTQILVIFKILTLHLYLCYMKTSELSTTLQQIEWGAGDPDFSFFEVLLGGR